MLVVIVAAILSFTAIKLQPIQERNVRIEKIQNILSSVSIESTVENAEDIFDKYIVDSYVLDYTGAKVEGSKAFDINLSPEVKAMYEVKKLNAQLKKAEKGSIESIKSKIQEAEGGRKLPVFVCEKDGNK